MKLTKKIRDKGKWSERLEYRNETGRYHREDGPAIEYESGLELWYLDGDPYSEIGYKKKLYKRNIEKLRGE